MKRFWSTARATAASDGWSVTLDDKLLTTPARRSLRVPTAPLAAAIAEEWAAVVDEVRPDQMPLTRAANAAIDKVAPDPDAVAVFLADYGQTDLLSYRAEAPSGLVARQSAAWDPLVAQAAAAYDARLAVTTGVMPVAQDPHAMARLGVEVGRRDAFALTGLHDLVTISGSLLLGLLADDDLVTVEAAWAAATVDEAWQVDTWGHDAEAAATLAARAAAFHNAHRFNRLAAGG